MILKLFLIVIHKIYLLSVKILLKLNNNKYSKAFVLNKLIKLNNITIKNLNYKIPIIFEKNDQTIFNLNGIKIINSDLHRRHLKNFDSTNHNEAQKFLKYFIDDNERTIIDLGANEGEISIFFAKKINCRVFAIECAKKNLDLLNKNIALNKVKNIKVFRYAISDKDDVKLNINFKSNQTSVFNQDSSIKVSNEIETVNSITLSSFIKEQNISFIDFIKIDIENSNYLVSDCILKNSNKIKTIMWELGFQKADNYKKTIVKLSKEFKFYIELNNDFVELNIDEIISKIEKEVRMDSDGFDVLLFNKKFDNGKGIII